MVCRGRKGGVPRSSISSILWIGIIAIPTRVKMTENIFICLIIFIVLAGGVLLLHGLGLLWIRLKEKFFYWLVGW